MPLTSVTKDAENLVLTVVGDYTVAQQRLWDAFADPRQLERFWGPPTWPATFTRHDLKVGGRSEYFLSGPDGEKWNGSWRFTVVEPIDSFEACDGEDNVDDEDLPASMKFAFDATSAGSRLTIVTKFASVEAMEQTIPGMEEGLRAAMPQLDEVLTEADSHTN
jgi:uncharacterized protein YndB with AHSA1/START domain